MPAWANLDRSNATSSPIEGAGGIRRHQGQGVACLSSDDTSHLTLSRVAVSYTHLDVYKRQVLNRQENNRLALKFVVPGDLKRDLQLLAAERNIALSALLRLIASEYVRRNRLS